MGHRKLAREFYGMYRDVREAAGVPDNVWSSRARHGGGTETRKAGAPIDDIADHLQKSDVEGTRRNYMATSRRRGGWRASKNKLVCGYQPLGDRKVKNITDPVRVYRVLPDPTAFKTRKHQETGPGH